MGDHDPGGGAHRLSPAAPDEQYVYGSCSPGWHSAGDHDAALDQWIEQMRSAGIERVCCLLPGRHLDDGLNVDRYQEAFGAERVVHTPVPDGSLVGVRQLRGEILPFLAEGVAADEPAVVHCLSGLCRTGQVLAAWLIHGRGYEPTGAVDAVLETGRDPTIAVTEGNATRADLFDLLGAVAGDTRS